MATIEDIAQIVAVISAAYPNFNPTENTVEVYCQTLKDIDAELLKAATLQAISEPGRKFAPSVGEIRGAIIEIRKTVSDIPDSFRAWTEVKKAMVEVGSYRKPEFSSPVIAEAVRAMGWKNLCLSENEVADRAHFVKAYEQLVRRIEADTNYLPEVRGYIEENRANSEIKLLADKLSVNK